MLRTALLATLVSTMTAWSQDSAIKTGPAVGAPIPAFEAVDQQGNTQTFESLRGPNGLYLVFVRSADW